MSKYWPELNVVNDSSIVAKPFLIMRESGGKGFFMTNDNNVYLGGRYDLEEALLARWWKCYTTFWLCWWSVEQCIIR